MNERAAWRVRALARATRRVELGLARETVAARIGISSRVLRQWEVAAYRPSERDERAWEAALFRAVD